MGFEQQNRAGIVKPLFCILQLQDECPT